GHCRVTQKHNENGFSLGRWASKQRHKRESLSPERKARLDALGFVWDVLAAQWEEGFSYLKVFKRREGHCRVPDKYKENAYRLGQWVANERQHQNQNKDAERKARLDALGFDWNPYDTDWEEGFEYLQAYVKEYKHCRVPIQYKTLSGYRLGRWVSVQRVSQTKLSSERKIRLDKLGFDWDPITTQWEEGFEHLQAYVKEYKDCRVPQQYKSPDDYKLGQWVNNQRHRPSSVSPERKARLDALGFDSDPFTTQWEEGFGYLKAFNQREGHCRVPQKHKENGFSL